MVINFWKDIIFGEVPSNFEDLENLAGSRS